MSCSFYAVAGLGVMIPHDRLCRKAQMRDCPHDAPLTAKFCPECGERAWREEEVPIEGYLPEGNSDNGYEPTLCGLAVYVHGGRETGSDHRALVTPSLVRARGESSKDAVQMANPDVESARTRLRDVLEPLGLWDGSAFGLWVLADVSY